MRGVRTDRVEDRVAQRAFAHVGLDLLEAGLTMGVIAMEAVSEPVGTAIEERHYRRKTDAVADRFRIFRHHILVDLLPWLRPSLSGEQFQFELHGVMSPFVCIRPHRGQRLSGSGSMRTFRWNVRPSRLMSVRYPTRRQ